MASWHPPRIKHPTQGDKTNQPKNEQSTKNRTGQIETLKRELKSVIIENYELVYQKIVKKRALIWHFPIMTIPTRKTKPIHFKIKNHIRLNTFRLTT